MDFTLVSTVFNEAKRIEATINDLQRQTLQPSEIIITDAGSTDGTYERLLEWKSKSPIPITILQKQRCNVAEGRNLAIQAAKTDIIASMDFGCRFNPEWLKSLILPFRDPAVQVVAGIHTVEKDQQITLAAKAAYIIYNGYTVEYASPYHLPSSRSIAYKKDVFNDIGGYCEWLTLAADDTVFGLQLKAKGYNIKIIDKPFVFWGRHKAAASYAKESFRYGLGDGEANINVRAFQITIAECALRYFFVVLSFLAILVKPSSKEANVLLFVSLLISIIGFRAYIKYIRSWLKFKSLKYNLKVLLYGFYLLERIKLNYIKGYIKGRLFSSTYQKEQAKKLQHSLKFHFS